MNIGPKLVPKPALKQTLTPGLVQMVNLLTLNKLDLQDAITQELLQNPLLDEVQEPDEATEPITIDQLIEAESRLRQQSPDQEVLDATREPADGGGRDVAAAGEAEMALPAYEMSLNGAAPATSESEPAELEAAPESATETAVDPFDEIDFGDFFEKYLDPGSFVGESEEIERPTFENFLSAPTTLSDHLRWQLNVSPAEETVRDAAEAIIGNLDEDGYLTAEEERRRPLQLEEIAEMEQLPLAAVQAGLELVQSFDPTGVACRDLRECLRLQLKQLPLLQPLVLTLVEDYLPALQNRDYKGIARALGVQIESIQAALAAIRQLDPHPGRRYNKTQARLIEPDLFFVKGRAQPCPICGLEDCENEFRILLNDDGLPQLTINRGYRSMKWDKSERDVSRYIRERYSSAIQFLKNLEQRKHTIARVCHSIIARQAEFLDLGMDALKPMMIKEVAEEIGVHPSTVSRAVANKYAHTPQGVLELRFFFTESVQGERGGETSLFNLKRRVKKLIEEEDAAHPLTDERITALLRGEGILVTRRTVAKYREDMHIPSTHQRRRKP